MTTHGTMLALTIEPNARFRVPGGARWKLRIRPKQPPTLYVRRPGGIEAWLLKPAVNGIHDLALRVGMNRSGYSSV